MNRNLLLLLIIFSFTIQLVKSQKGTVVPFTSDERTSILNYHNNLRAAVNANNMPALIWNDNLDLWLNWPTTCLPDHTPNSYRGNVAGYSYVGENLAFASANLPVATLISGWGAEKASYTYGPMSLTNFVEVGHYTQIMWAATVAIGCVRINCTGVAGGVGGFVIACNYGPGGNYLNKYPYTLCASGSNCNLLSPTSGGAALISNGGGVPAASSSPSISRSSNPSATSTATKTAAASLSPSSTISLTSAASISNSRTPTSAPSASASPVPSCVPKTCAANSCGTIPTGCGGSITCKTCPSGQNCVQNTCVACTPTNSCSNKQCGTINTGCGTTAFCGNCTLGNICENYACTANPVCQSCRSASAVCGTITISGCPIQSCGSCSSTSVCKLGKCVALATGCTGASACLRNQACVNGTCKCLDGYYQPSGSSSGTSGCIAISTIPIIFDEIYNSNGNNYNITGDWVYDPIALNANNSTYTTPEMSALLSVGESSKLAWNNAEAFSSLELTTISAQVLFNDPKTMVGIGMRLNQANSQRQSDAIQWNVDANANVQWNLIWYDNDINYGTRATGSLNSPVSSVWNTISLSVVTTSFSGVNWQSSTFSINNKGVVIAQAVRPYDVLGGAYLYSSGPSSFRNVLIYTRTSLLLSIANCMSSSSFASLVSNVLGIPVSKVKVSNVTVNGQCAGQSGTATGKRQADAVGNTFVVGLESIDGVTGSRGLASSLMQLAESWDDTMADTGGVNSVEYADPSGGLNSGLYDANAVDLTSGGATGGGLGAGAIAGIVVGSVVGAVLIGAVVLAVIGAIVFLIVRKGRRSDVDDKERTTSVNTATTTVSSSNLEGGGTTPKGGGGVDMYELSPRHHKSITGRVPSGYQPDVASIEQN